LTAQSSERRNFLICACVLFTLNVYVVRGFFVVAYTHFMGSIEGAYISLAHQLAQHWDLSWWPLWYAGIPYQNTYPPLLHWMDAIAVRAAHVSAAHAYHAVTALFYCSGPVTVFWMAYRLSTQIWPSFAGALLYSLFSPSALLIPSVRFSLGDVFGARRLQALVQYGEGPHIASLALLPVAAVVLDYALTKRRPVFCVLAAVSMALVVLTNWLGAFSLAAVVIAYILSRPRAEWKRLLVACASLGALAYAFVAPWVPPSTIAAVRVNAQLVGGPYAMTAMHLFYAGAILAGLALVWLFLERSERPAHLRFLVLFSFLMGVPPLAAAWLAIFIVPQAERYHLQMEMALCLLASFAIAPAVGRLARSPRLAVILVLAACCALQARHYRRAAREWALPLDIQTTSEYRVAKWIDQNMNGHRVFVPGSDYFWLNAFTDAPQLAGGFDQGITNPIIPDLGYQLLAGEGTTKEGELGVLWLKAFGVHAVGVGGPRSTEVYKATRHWKKYEGLLPVLFRDGDDVIYRVLPDSESLAHALRPQPVLTQAPHGVLDMGWVTSYVAALYGPDAPPVEMRWINHHHAVLAADLNRDQLLAVQVTYHPGWRARVNASERTITKDPIGLLLIAPQCAGRCTIDLEFQDDTEMLVARMASWTALSGSMLWVLASLLRRKRAPSVRY
jgi:hypothetical protein